MYRSLLARAVKVNVKPKEPDEMSEEPVQKEPVEKTVIKYDVMQAPAIASTSDGTGTGTAVAAVKKSFKTQIIIGKRPGLGKKSNIRPPVIKKSPENPAPVEAQPAVCTPKEEPPKPSVTSPLVTQVTRIPPTQPPLPPMPHPDTIKATNSPVSSQPTANPVPHGTPPVSAPPTHSGSYGNFHAPPALPATAAPYSAPPIPATPYTTPPVPSQQTNPGPYNNLQTPPLPATPAPYSFAPPAAAATPGPYGNPPPPAMSNKPPPLPPDQKPPTTMAGGQTWPPSSNAYPSPDAPWHRQGPPNQAFNQRQPPPNFRPPQQGPSSQFPVRGPQFDQPPPGPRWNQPGLRGRDPGSSGQPQWRTPPPSQFNPRFDRPPGPSSRPPPPLPPPNQRFNHPPGIGNGPSLPTPNQKFNRPPGNENGPPLPTPNQRFNRPPRIGDETTSSTLTPNQEFVRPPGKGNEPEMGDEPPPGPNQRFNPPPGIGNKTASPTPNQRFVRPPGMGNDPPPHINQRFNRPPGIGNEPPSQAPNQRFALPPGIGNEPPSQTPNQRFVRPPGIGNEPPPGPNQRFVRPPGIGNEPPPGPIQRFDRPPGPRPNQRFDRPPGPRPNQRFDCPPGPPPNMRFGHPPGGRMEHPSPRLGERFNRPPGSRMQLQNVSQQSKGFGGPPTGPTRMERPPFRPGKGFGQTSNNANLEELPAASPAKKKPATDKPDGNIQSRLLSLSGMAPGPSQEKPDSRKRGGSEPAVVHPEKRSNVPPPEQQQQLQPPPLTQQQPQPPPPKQQQQPPPHKNAVPSLLEIPIKTVVAGPSVHRKPNVLDSVAEIATPLCKFPMEEQLIMKEDRTLEFFNELGEKITGVNGACRAWFDHQIAKHEYYVKLDRILPSPMVEGYCNHCEFAIGTHPDTKQLTIGYTYEATNAFVGPIQHLVHIPGPIKQLVFRLESILRETKVKPFDQKTSQGCWIKLNARISAESGIMVTLTLNAKGMEAAALKNFKTKMVSALTESQQLMVTSVYIVARSQLDSGKPELIFGEKSILSAVVDKSFHVSPFSSYSRNISTMVEILKLLRQMSNLTAQTSLVDICCGSGTIGIALSPFCGQVIGLDVLPEAVDEARVNSVENDADNCEFHVGSAEEFLPSLWSRVVFMEDVVCIMDLPPSGLAAKAVQHIRKQSAIKRFFLILSDPRGCLQTCLAFARMPSNQTKGDPFIPVRAIPVDTHPHTHGFTILIMFVRMKIGDLLNPESINLEDVSATSDRVSNSSDPPAADGAATPSDLSDQQQSSEPDGKEGGPDLSWKPVTKEGELAASRERLLTPDNLDWLNQMNNVHGSSFERAQWIETLLMQQNSASAEQTPPT